MLLFTNFGISHSEGHNFTWSSFQLDTLSVFYLKYGKQIFPRGLDSYYFPIALDVHFDKYAKSPALENKHLSFFKWLIPLTCSCNIRVHTQQPLQWAEYGEQHSKKSNHDNECLESGLRHRLISSVHSPPPFHLPSAPSSASLFRLQHPCAAPFFCPPLPHLPDLIWRRSRCYREIEKGWERHLHPV